MKKKHTQPTATRNHPVTPHQGQEESAQRQGSLVLSHSVKFSSPFPPPEILSAYNDAIPGLADTLISLVVQQTNHRQELERTDIDAQIFAHKAEFTEARIGQICAFLLSLSFLAAGYSIILHGYSWPGALLGSSGIAGLVTAFIKGRKE